MKVSAVVVVAATITWQTRNQHQEMNARSQGISSQQVGMVQEPWVKFRKEQVKELTRTMPNRFALSKAYYGKEDAILQSVELDRLKGLGEQVEQSTPKS